MNTAEDIKHRVKAGLQVQLVLQAGKPRAYHRVTGNPDAPWFKNIVLPARIDRYKEVRSCSSR